MRILQVIGQTRVGGAESFAFILSCELARRGHEVCLLANRSNGPLLDRELPPGMTGRALDRSSRWDPRILSFLDGSVRQFRPQIIHGHNFEANTWARVVGLVHPRLKVFCHEHSSLKIYQPRHRLLLDRCLYPRCSTVFVVNRTLGELLRSRHHVPPDKVEEVPNGIDVARFAPPEGAARDPLAVVCVASLIAVKNHDVLLRAWAEVARRQPGARLTLVGDGPLGPSLKALARELGCAESVHFAGAAGDVRPHLWRSTIFVLPSHLEALPLSLLEARAAGLACVASRVGGIPDAMGDEEMGLLPPPDDAPALAAALLTLLESPERCRRAGEKARSDVALRYGIGPCVDRIEAAYRRALEGGK